MSIDIDIVSHDKDTTSEIVDNTLIYLIGVARSRLSSEGIEVNTVSFGGETEEVRNNAADEYFFNATLSIDLEVEWELHVPILATLRNNVQVSSEDLRKMAGLDDEELAAIESQIRAMRSLHLEAARDPYFASRNRSLESIR